MKKLFLILLILLPCNLEAGEWIMLGQTEIVDTCRGQIYIYEKDYDEYLKFKSGLQTSNLGAQEGCGWWVKPTWLPSIDDEGGTMAYFDSLGFQPDSVWVPKPCLPQEMEPKGCEVWVKLSSYGKVDDLGKYHCFIYPAGIPRPGSVWIHPPNRKSVENVKCLTLGWVRIGTNPCIYGNPLSATLWISDGSTHPISVWVPKPCPDTMWDWVESCSDITTPVRIGDKDTLRENEKITHLVFQVWDKQPCNPGSDFKLFCPPSKLDSSIVREAMCEEDYYTMGYDSIDVLQNHIYGWFPCYCLILDGIRYWMKENPLSEEEK